MEISLSFTTQASTGGAVSVPLETLIAFQAILVALLIPVAIMVFEQRKRDDLPGWLTVVLLKKCAKPGLILASTLISSISLFIYEAVPYISLTVFTLSSCEFIHRMHSIYMWYKETISHPDLGDSPLIEKYIISYLRDDTKSNADDIVYTWRETWCSQFARHALTPKLLDAFLEALKSSDSKRFDDLVRTIDTKILSGKIPIYAGSTISKLCSIAIYTLSKHQPGFHAYSNILQVLVRRSIKDEKLDLVIEQLDKQLRDFDSSARKVDINKLVSVIVEEMFCSSIDKINRIQFTAWSIATLCNKGGPISTSICESLLRKFKMLFNRDIFVLESTADDRAVMQNTNKLLAVETTLLNNSVDIEQLNMALSLDRAIITARSLEIDKTLDSWLSKPHPYIQHYDVIWTSILDANDTAASTPEQLHNLFVAKENKLRAMTIEVVRKMAPAFVSNAAIITEYIMKHKENISSTNLPNDALCKLIDLLSQLNNKEKKNKEDNCDDTTI